MPATKKRNMARAMRVSLIVGVILNLINNAQRLLDEPTNPTLLLQVVLTFLVPFLVSLYSSTQTRKDFAKAEVEHDEIRRLASFPAQNPNPVIEVRKSGTVTFCNEAADEYFPDLRDQKLQHPALERVRNLLEQQGFERLPDYWGEFAYRDSIFELKLYHVPGSDIIRIYYTDISELKAVEARLTSMALFPEQNPNPVVEADFSANLVTYMNPGATLMFPGLESEGMAHPFFDGIHPQLAHGVDFQCHVEINDRVLEQKIYFLPQGGQIRVFTHDITERIENERNLARLASFPEGNPSPIVEFNLSGDITYLNPAARTLLHGIEELGRKHEMMAPFQRHKNQLSSGSINFYREEVRYADAVYSQRGSMIDDAGVIRVFSIDITEQKQQEELIAEKNRSITDSINYAQKIQRAILPATDKMVSEFPDSFLLYEPKDIVSGDFYWFAQVNDVFVYVCADCTGHGVPGALMSMIGSNIIDQLVRHSSIQDPGTALTQLDFRIREVLQQDDEATEQTRDGMDLSMCAINKQTGVLQFAAANHSLVHFSNGALTEIRGNRQAVGGRHSGLKQFDTQTLQVQPGDCLYSFTDGFIDQFGGPKGKKMMKKRLFAQLRECWQLPMSDQRTLLHQYLKDWQGHEEQVDDVLVMGLRI